MSEHTSSTGPSRPPGDPPAHTPHGWRRRVAIGAVIATVSGVITTVVVMANRDQDAGAPSAGTTVATSTTTPPTSGPIATPSTSTAPASTVPTQDRPSAAAALAPFFAAATRLDGQLHDAATAVNNSGPHWRTITESLARTVRAADLAPVATTIPAGLPRDLLRSVILVYSDLASRRFAMADFSIATTIDPHAFPNSEDLLRHLGRGHAAAARYADDLAAARSLAGSSPAVTAPPATSRAAAEVRLYARYVEAINGGCDSRGGHILTSLPPVVWNGQPGNGTIAGVPFTAWLGTDRTWQIRLTAC